MMILYRSAILLFACLVGTSSSAPLNIHSDEDDSMIGSLRKEGSSVVEDAGAAPVLYERDLKSSKKKADKKASKISKKKASKKADVCDGDAPSTVPCIATRLATLSQLFVDNEISIQALQDPSTPHYVALEWMTNIDSTDLQWKLSDDALVERFVLVLLYFTTGGANWSSQADFLSPSLDICSWIIRSKGVLFCNDEGSVTELDLLQNGLIGSLPTEIGLLSSLRRLYLQNNALTGTLPTQLGALSSLEYLDLGDNKLSGAVPSELGQIATLQFLWLQNNALTGTLPTQLGTLSSLKFLSLGSNNLSGAVPSELGQIATLESLYLGFNALTGTVPTQLGSLSSLKSLFLANNKLSGAVPSELGQIATLESLILGSSGLTGTIPPEIDQNQVDVLFP